MLCFPPHTYLQATPLAIVGSKHQNGYGNGHRVLDSVEAFDRRIIKVIVEQSSEYPWHWVVMQDELLKLPAGRFTLKDA